MESGYDYLASCLISAIRSDFQKPQIESKHSADLNLMCFECAETGNYLESDSEKLVILSVTALHQRLILFLLSLAFDYHLTPTLFSSYLDSSFTQSFHGLLQLRNISILRMVFKILEQEDEAVRLFAMKTLELIIRLNPLTAIIIEAEGGIVLLQKLFVNSVFVQSMLPLHPEDLPGNIQRGNRSRSTSSGTTSTSSGIPSQTGGQSISTEEIKEYNKELESLLRLTVSTVHLLVRISVILSEKNSTILTLFVIQIQQICCRLKIRGGNQDINSNFLSEYQKLRPKCSNCEAEVAEFECMHHR
jgi:hypothetical protein